MLSAGAHPDVGASHAQWTQLANAWPRRRGSALRAEAIAYKLCASGELTHVGLH